MPKNDWNGTLTTENAGRVADRLRQLLEGRRFTAVLSSKHVDDFRPGVYVDCELENQADSRASIVFSPNAPAMLTIYVRAAHNFNVPIPFVVKPVQQGQETSPSHPTRFHFEDRWVTLTVDNPNGEVSSHATLIVGP